MAKKKKRKNLIVRYPWQRWFDRGRFILHRGREYHCQTHSMATLIRLTVVKPKYELNGVSLRISEDVITAEVY